MKIYLDIDDTLIHTDLFDMRPAKHLKEFLTHMLNNHDVYWLTTHCDGDATVPVAYLGKFFPEDLMELIIKIKPSSWKTFKIEAINLEDDFLWFDDVLMQYEEKVLKEADKLDSHIKVDLDKDPDFLSKYLST
jgi:hypothetical protein